MKKRVTKLIIILVTSILLLVSLCLLAFQIYFHGCVWWECAPQRAFTVYDLNIPDSFFPEKSEFNTLQYLHNENIAIEAAAATIYWDNGQAIYYVKRFPTIAKATRQFNFDKVNRFSTAQIVAAIISDIEDYPKLNADESTIRCGYVLSDLRCIFVGKYQEFTIFFSGSIGEEGMTEEEILNVIKYLDNKMVTLLNKKLK